MSARRRKAEEEEERARESADWEKNQNRIREYLDSLSQEKRMELEIGVANCARTDFAEAQTEHYRLLRFGHPGRPKCRRISADVARFEHPMFVLRGNVWASSGIQFLEFHFPVH
jgi:hypothetical protein